MDFGSAFSVQPHPFSASSFPLRMNRSRRGRRDALVILHPVEREGKKKYKQLGKKYGPCTSFCCGVIRHSLSIDCADPFSEGCCYFVSSAQTRGIVSGLIRKQTVKFLFTGMRALVWASKESAHHFCERACASLYGGSRGLGRGRWVGATWWPYVPLDIATS